MKPFILRLLVVAALLGQSRALDACTGIRIKAREGAVIAARVRKQGQDVVDSTLWASASDLRNLRYSFQTYPNRRIRMIDLKSLDFDAGAISSIPMAGDEVVEDVSGRAPSAR